MDIGSKSVLNDIFHVWILFLNKHVFCFPTENKLWLISLKNSPVCAVDVPSSLYYCK